MDSVGLLERAQAVGLRVWVEGEQLRVRGHKDHTAVVQEILAHKAEVIALLTSPPTGETAAAAAPACEHPQAYRRPSGVLVCTGCGAAQVPGNPTWHPQRPLYCDEGQHVPYVDTPADQPRQCMKCPYVWDTPAADTPRHPEVHDPRCAGHGLTVMPGVGWDCPTCQQQYRVPIVPAGVLHLWSELLQDDIYGTDSRTQAQALWATHHIAAYTPGELRHLRHLQRTDPDTFPDKLTVIHRFKREFGCRVDEVIILQPTEQET